MPNFTEKDLEDFVDYIDNETQTDDLSASEYEIELFAIQRELLIQKKLQSFVSILSHMDHMIWSSTFKNPKMSCNHSLRHQVEFNLNLTFISFKK